MSSLKRAADVDEEPSVKIARTASLADVAEGALPAHGTASLGDVTESSRPAPRVIPSTCTHVCAPGDGGPPIPVSYQNEVIELNAKIYPFVLDTFQREAVVCLERNESVLIAAHTSAGKTAVAEYERR